MTATAPTISRQIPRRDAVLRQVAVLLEPMDAWGRGVAIGISRYVQRMGRWRIFTSPSQGTTPIRLPQRWKGHGVIARVDNEDLEKQLTEMGCPVVNLSANFRYRSRFPRVAMAYESVGLLAGEHLLDRGFRHFAAVGAAYPVALINRFILLAHKHGFDCSVYTHQIVNSSHPDWNRQARRLIRWLLKLPKPVGILAYQDRLGRLLIDYCHEVGLSVPDEVAVVGMMNDQVVCEMGYPALSSVAMPTERQGFEAARLLDRLMDGQSPPGQTIWVEPTEVIARASTDTLAVADPDVAAVLRLIRDHAKDGIQVGDVLDQIPISRRSLERRFVQWVHRTPAEQIRRVRLETCKRLLTTTNLKGPEVAAAAGFSTQAHMITAFRQAMHMTPAAYRRRMTM